MQSKRAAPRARSSASSLEPTAVDLDVVAADELDDRLALVVVVLDHEQWRAGRSRNVAELATAPASSLGRRPRRTPPRRRAARSGARSPSPTRRTGMWRVRGSLLEALEQRAALGSCEVEQRSRRAGTRARAPTPPAPPCGDEHLEARPRAPRSSRGGASALGADDEQHPVARRERRRGRRRRRRRDRLGLDSAVGASTAADAAAAAAPAARRARDAGASRSRRRRRGSSVAGSSSVNVLPSPGVDVDLDLAAEQAGDLAADRQAEARAAVAPAGRRRRPAGRPRRSAAACPAAMPMPVSRDRERRPRTASPCGAGRDRRSVDRRPPR